MWNIDLSWFFWTTVLILFAESWGRAMMVTRRASRRVEGRTNRASVSA